MQVGPLRRFVGALGLVALVPLLLMVWTGALAPVDAAVRAAVTVAALLLLGRVAGWGVELLAAEVESADDVGEPARAATAFPVDT